MTAPGPLDTLPDYQGLVDAIPAEQFPSYAEAIRQRLRAGEETPDTVALLRAINVRESRSPLYVTISQGIQRNPWPWVAAGAAALVALSRWRGRG